VVSSHGDNDEEISSMRFEEYPVAITDVIKAVNKGKKKLSKKFT
jgi:hypothetical protein